MKQLWMKKANRDAAFMAAGGKKAGFKKTSTTNQSINPKYVIDSWCGGQRKDLTDILQTIIAVFGLRLGKSR